MNDENYKKDLLMEMRHIRMTVDLIKEMKIAEARLAGTANQLSEEIRQNGKAPKDSEGQRLLDDLVSQLGKE